MLQVESSYGRDFVGPCLRSNYFVVYSNERNWITETGYLTVKGNNIIGNNANFLKLESGDIIFLFDQNVINDSQKSLSTNSRINEISKCVVEKVIARNILQTETPCFKPLNYKGDYVIGKPFYEFPAKNYKKEEKVRVDSLIDFYTPENLIITKSYNKYYANRYIFHPGFLITNQGNTVYRMKLEKMYNNFNNLAQTVSLYSEYYYNLIKISQKAILKL